MKLPLISSLISTTSPPQKWLLAAIILSGLFFGFIGYLFYISKAWSYASDKPETCVNCHIMAPEYATWGHSSHRQYATCNDCHVPHNNIFNKYYFKAKDGLRHAAIFTLRREPQVIFIKDEGREAVLNNCVRCHGGLFDKLPLGASVCPDPHDAAGKTCIDCHREVPHGRVHSLSSAPNARVPLPASPVPEWLTEKLDK